MRHIVSPNGSSVKQTLSRFRSALKFRDDIPPLFREAITVVCHAGVARGSVCNLRGDDPEGGRARAEDGCTGVQLQRQHAAEESVINVLEGHGLGRCPDHGPEGFQSHVAPAVVTRNIQQMSVLLRQQEAAADDVIGKLRGSSPLGSAACRVERSRTPGVRVRRKEPNIMRHA